MIVTINGQPENFPAPLRLDELLARQGLDGMMIAVAHNGHVIRKSDYAKLSITGGDSLEIVAPMQSG